jgi:hypothetical protein
LSNIVFVSAAWAAKKLQLAASNWQSVKTVLLIANCQLLFAEMVELTGIEPVTSCLQSRRSPN